MIKYLWKIIHTFKDVIFKKYYEYQPLHAFIRGNLVEINAIYKDEHKDLDLYVSRTQKNIETIAAKFIKKIWGETHEEIKRYTQSIYKTIDYILREIIDNVYTHSGDSKQRLHSNLYMMQYYEKTNILRICIADSWMWIKNSYVDTKYYDENERDDFYINLSLKRNVSSTFEKKERNAGNWLHMSSELVKAMKSKMTIVSWSAIVEIWQTKKTSYSDTTWDWTLINLEFDLSQLTNKWVLDDISKVNKNDYSEDDQEVFDTNEMKQKIEDLFI